MIGVIRNIVQSIMVMAAAMLVFCLVAFVVMKVWEHDMGDISMRRAALLSALSVAKSPCVKIDWIYHRGKGADEIFLISPKSDPERNGGVVVEWKDYWKIWEIDFCQNKLEKLKKEI